MPDILRLQPSRLRDYSVCPMQYRLRHLERRGPSRLPPTPALTLGLVLHSALAEWHQPGSPPLEHDAPALLARHWRRVGFATAREEAEYLALARHALQRYLQALEHQQGLVLGTEVYLSRIIVHAGQQAELACRADRVTRLPDGSLEVLDYKTNQDGQVPEREQLAGDLPTFIYYLLARLTYPEHARITTAQLNLFTLQKVSVDYSPAELARNKAQLLATIAAIEARALAPRSGPHCAWCPVRRECPAFGPAVEW